jgi:RND family efflux transporter MFP subunit
VDRRLKDPGNLVGSGESTILAEVNQIDPIYVYFTINEKDLLRLMGESQVPPERAAREKRPLFLGLANEKGFPHQGHLDFAAISLTSSSGTLLLRGIFPNPDGMILAGLFARVRVPVAREKSALLVPKVALGFDQQGPYVLVVNEKKVVERRAVILGPEVDTARVVEEGLQGDEWVVVVGMLKAIPGRPVDPEKEAPQAPASRKDTSSHRAGKKKARS